MIALPEVMIELIDRAVDAIRNSRKVLAISHNDADGIASMAIVIEMLQREDKELTWRNIHQLNSETILIIDEMIKEIRPDLVIFSDLGTGQIHHIQDYVVGKNGVEKIIILDHHLPSGERVDSTQLLNNPDLIEINPCQHGLSGSSDVSGAGVSFIVAYRLSTDNVDLSELAIIGATGDLQDYYGKGFVGLNEEIIRLSEENQIIKVDKDLTFFGINTRPLIKLLQYATDPYLPGITGNIDACYEFYADIGIELQSPDDSWKRWVDLRQEEKQKIIQKLIGIVLEFYDNPSVASGLLGDIITLLHRKPKSEMRSAKEFSTLLNACGRNRRAEVGVRICLNDPDAFSEGRTLLQQHRKNLALAIRRIEDGGYEERPGMYIINDPETQHTIIGIVIGMAQGSRIIPWNKPVIGISTNTIDESVLVKISGRAKKQVLNQGVNLKDIFTEIGSLLNERHGSLRVEAGGHPMAAGAFVHRDSLDEFLDEVSMKLDAIIG